MFYFNRDKSKERLWMGQEGKFGPGELVIKSPAHGHIRIIKDGFLFKRVYGNELSIKIHEGGVYRVEVLRKTPIFGWRPWIFSNPIYLR